ncbi:hypothetical protein BH11PLA1_BH11PLA1_19470 [soil metagenome]
MADRLAQLEKLLALDPADTFTLYALAQEYGKRADYARAVDFYDRTLATDAAYCYAYFHKARAQQALGDLPAARLTVQAGIAAAHRAADAKASSELASLQTELIEA